MAIRELEITGYRSFKHVTWKPGPLNLVVGPNGSGKTNLLQFLNLISRAAHGRLAWSIAHAGGMVPLLWDHQPGSLGWNLSIDAPNEDKPDRTATYEVLLRQLGGGSAYQIEQDSLIFWLEPSADLGSSRNMGYRRESGDLLIRGVFEGKTTNFEWEQDYDKNESLIGEVTGGVASRLQAWTYHRDIPTDPGSPMRRPTTTQFVDKLEPSGDNLVPVLHTFYTSNRDFKTAIDDGMRAGFGDEYERLEFQPAAAQQIQLAVQWKSSTEPHAGQDLSDGTLRYLFLLTALAHPKPPPLVMIEEPDVGLHPSMLSIIADFAADAAERTQLVFTSHSPDFLDAFSSLSPTVTLCHWEDGQTQLYTLDAQRLEKWLERYRLGHLFTSGELDNLALPDVDPVEAEDLFKDLPPEDAAVLESAGGPTDGENG
jgi:predicted ATPase